MVIDYYKVAYHFIAIRQLPRDEMVAKSVDGKQIYRWTDLQSETVLGIATYFSDVLYLA